MSNWFYRPTPINTPRLRMFCFPFAGGNAQFFAKWNKYFPADIDICSAQLPGRGIRHNEKSFLTLEPLVDALLPELRPLMDVQTVFFGYSLGALISYQVLHRLQKEKQPLPNHFVVCAARAPHLPPPPQIHQLPNAEFISVLQSRYGGVPEVVLREPELMSFFLPPVRADFSLIDHWVYQSVPPLEVPIVAIGGSSDAIVTAEGLSAWRELTSRSFSMELFPGGHFFMNEHLTLVLENIAKKISA